jgi:hypothetical protein
VMIFKHRADFTSRPAGLQSACQRHLRVVH